MAPEQILRQECDARTDIYALGIIIYQLLTGSFPFDGQTQAEIVIKQVNQPVPPLRFITHSIDTQLGKMALRCLEKKPEARYQNMDEFLIDLESLNGGSRSETASFKKPIVMVVDDDPVIRDLLNSVFTLQGFKMVTATNGEEAVAKAWAEKPDLILMDLVMPKMDGYRAAELLGQHPGTSKIPIFLVTSKDNRELRVYSKTIGIKQFIPKPFDIPKLVEMVHLHIKVSHIH